MTAAAPGQGTDPVGKLASIRSRILGYREVPARSLRVHPKNYRTHPEYQTDSVRKVLARIGWVDVLKTRELPDGSLELFDGHLRRDIAGDELVPVLVTDLDDRETEEVLAVFDQLASLAVPDRDKLSGLLSSLKGLGTPLTEMGWPQYKLEDAISSFVPPASLPRPGEDAVNAAAALPDPNAAQAGEDPDAPHPGEGFKQFAVPLTVAQEMAVRSAIGIAKVRFNAQSSGDALAALIEEWLRVKDARPG